MTNQFHAGGSRVTRSGAIAMACLWLCAGTAAADVVTDWNNTVVGVTIGGARSNPETGAAAAYMHIAMYDAVSSIDGRYTPFATRVANVSPGASREAAANEAAYRILAALYPAASFPTLASQFAAAYTSALNAIPNGQAKTDGIAVGVAAANGLIAKRQNDGFRANVAYTFQPLDPGVYQKTPGPDCTIDTYAGPAAPWMKAFKPFALLSLDQFRAPTVRRRSEARSGPRTSTKSGISGPFRPCSTCAAASKRRSDSFMASLTRNCRSHEICGNWRRIKI